MGRHAWDCVSAAMALPAAFPYRDLIAFTTFLVVLGTLAIQGLTLGPLLRALDLHDDDPVGRELRAARERALAAGLANLERDRSLAADAVRQEFTAHLGTERADATWRVRPRRALRPASRSAPCGASGRTPCAPTMKSATMPSTRSKRNWTGSRWREQERGVGGRERARERAPNCAGEAAHERAWGAEAALGRLRADEGDDGWIGAELVVRRDADGVYICCRRRGAS